MRESLRCFKYSNNLMNQVCIGNVMIDCCIQNWLISPKKTNKLLTLALSVPLDRNYLNLY